MVSNHRQTANNRKTVHSRTNDLLYAALSELRISVLAPPWPSATEGTGTFADAL